MKSISSLLSNNYFIATLFLLSLIFGFISLQTFIGTGFLNLSKVNVEILLSINLILLIFLCISIVFKIKINYSKKKYEELGEETSKNLIRSFIIISSLPSALIVIFSLIIFKYGIQNWFDNKILSLVNNSRNIAVNYLNDHQKGIIKDINLIAYDLNRNKNILNTNKKKFNEYLNFQAQFRDIQNIFIVDQSGSLQIANSQSETFLKPSADLLKQASNGKPLIISNANDKKTYALIKLNNYKNFYLYSFQNVDEKINSFLKETGNASTYYYQVKSNIFKIQITFFMIYIVFTLLLLMLSALFGINMASKTTRPLNSLFRAAKNISQDNYDISLPNESNKDFNNLNIIFNSMVDQIKKQKQKNILSGRYEAWQVIARKLAHEIRNPLTPIQLSLDRLKNKIDNNENSKKHFSIINNQILEISKLVNSFSNFARMPKPVLKKNNIKDILVKSLDVYKLNYDRIKFLLKINCTNFVIECDESQINRLLLNVYKNAVESIEEQFNEDIKNGEITTNLSEDNDYYIITILDNGIGFDENPKLKHDDPYFTTKKNGSGLGLSIVSKIVHEHNGHVFYENRKDSNGALVYISLKKKL
ncbi:ATP-binding protein [Pelagibacteraceae bacterium]|nr:ATP-binding protein [Pelagibacteraceae bacterium]